MTQEPFRLLEPQIFEFFFGVQARRSQLGMLSASCPCSLATEMAAIASRFTHISLSERRFPCARQRIRSTFAEPSETSYHMSSFIIMQRSPKRSSSTIPPKSWPFEAQELPDRTLPAGHMDLNT